MKLITNLDKTVSNRIQFLENRNNCLIMIEADDDNFYMNVVAKDFSRFESDVFLCKVDASKYELASAIRKYFNA